MAVGETILKITDYPIAYSIAFLLLKANNIDPLTFDAFPYLLAAGIGATFFTIVDPIGKIIKGYMSLVLHENFKKRKNKEKILTSWSEIKGSFNTAPIEVEKDKIVNIIYFVFILGLLMDFVADDEFFNNYFSSVVISPLDCDSDCWQAMILGLLSVVIAITAVIAGLKGAFILGRAKIVATYHKCINSPYVSDTTKQSLGEYIRLGDWETAKVWKSKIENEYIWEIGLQKEREEKKRVHINSILQKFALFKEECDKSNNQILLESFNQSAPQKEYFDIERIFKKFSNFEQLIQHCYSTKSNPLYTQFSELMKTNEQFSQELNQWFTTRELGVEKIIDSLSLTVESRTPHKVIGDNGQWINLRRLNEQFDDFIGYYEQRKMTFAPRPKANTHLFQVRFFDSDGDNQSQHDVVAELHEENAGKLSAELGHLAETLRNMNASAQREQVTRIEKKLEKTTDEVFRAFSIRSQTIHGYCKYCLNEEFWSEKEIPEKKIELDKIPEVVFDKSKFIPEWKKRKNKIGLI